MNIERRMLLDNPYIKKTTYENKCPNGFYKIALVFKDDKINYHFYREDKNKLWSHKDGWEKATNKDNDNKLIEDPKYCNRGDYTIFNNYYIVPIDSSLKNMANLYS
jgi:hypothetical protein